MELHWNNKQTVQYRFCAHRASNSHSLVYREYLSLDQTTHFQPPLPGCIGVFCRLDYLENAKDELLKQTFLKQIKPKPYAVNAKSHLHKEAVALY